MGRATSEKVGRGTCPNDRCGEPVTYRKSAGGMLTHKCEACDSSGYAEPGGDAYKWRMASIKDAPPADKKPEPKTEPVAAKRAAFSMGAL